MEHGVDERHIAIHAARSDPPQVPPQRIGSNRLLSDLAVASLPKPAYGGNQNQPKPKITAYLIHHYLRRIQTSQSFLAIRKHIHHKL